MFILCKKVTQIYNLFCRKNYFFDERAKISDERMKIKKTEPWRNLAQQEKGAVSKARHSASSAE